MYENIESLHNFMEAVQTKRMNCLSFEVKFYKDTQTLKNTTTNDDCITVSTQVTSHTEYLVKTRSNNPDIISILTSLGLNKYTRYQGTYYCNDDNLLAVLQSIQKQLPVINVELDKLLDFNTLQTQFVKLQNELNQANILANARAQADKGGPLGLGWNDRGQNPKANAIAQAKGAPLGRGWNDGGGRKKTYTVAILKEKLRKQGKAVSGTKAELEKRLSL